MTKIHKSVALALMATYQQHITIAGNSHNRLTLAKHYVELCIFADTSSEILQYGGILIKLGVMSEDIKYDFYSHDDTTRDFHTITITINIE